MVTSVEICSPEAANSKEINGATQGRERGGYSAHDLLSLGFISSPEHMKFVQNSRPLSSLNVEDLDAVLFVGGQGPMYYTDLLSLVASGAGVAIVPTSLRAIRRAGVLFRPLRERPMTQLDNGLASGRRIAGAPRVSETHVALGSSRNPAEGGLSAKLLVRSLYFTRSYFLSECAANRLGLPVSTSSSESNRLGIDKFSSLNR
jgi:hypothetical protein